MHLPSDLSIHPMHLAGNIGGIPHLAKNERDVGHPSFVRELEVYYLGTRKLSGMGASSDSWRLFKPP